MAILAQNEYTSTWFFQFFFYFDDKQHPQTMTINSARLGEMVRFPKFYKCESCDLTNN